MGFSPGAWAMRLLSRHRQHHTKRRIDPKWVFARARIQPKPRDDCPIQGDSGCAVHRNPIVGSMYALRLQHTPEALYPVGGRPDESIVGVTCARRKRGADDNGSILIRRVRHAFRATQRPDVLHPGRCAPPKSPPEAASIRRFTYYYSAITRDCDSDALGSSREAKILQSSRWSPAECMVSCSIVVGPFEGSPHRN